MDLDPPDLPPEIVDDFADDVRSSGSAMHAWDRHSPETTHWWPNARSTESGDHTFGRGEPMVGYCQSSAPPVVGAMDTLICESVMSYSSASGSSLPPLTSHCSHSQQRRQSCSEWQRRAHLRGAITRVPMPPLFKVKPTPNPGANSRRISMLKPLVVDRISTDTLSLEHTDTDTRMAVESSVAVSPASATTSARSITVTNGSATPLPLSAMAVRHDTSDTFTSAAGIRQPLTHSKSRMIPMDMASTVASAVATIGSVDNNSLPTNHYRQHPYEYGSESHTTCATILRTPMRTQLLVPKRMFSPPLARANPMPVPIASFGLAKLLSDEFGSDTMPKPNTHSSTTATMSSSRLPQAHYCQTTALGSVGHFCQRPLGSLSQTVSRSSSSICDGSSSTLRPSLPRPSLAAPLPMTSVLQTDCRSSSGLLQAYDSGRAMPPRPLSISMPSIASSGIKPKPNDSDTITQHTHSSSSSEKLTKKLKAKATFTMQSSEGMGRFQMTAPRMLVPPPRFGGQRETGMVAFVPTVEPPPMPSIFSKASKATVATGFGMGLQMRGSRAFLPFPNPNTRSTHTVERGQLRIDPTLFDCELGTPKAAVTVSGKAPKKVRSSIARKKKKKKKKSEKSKKSKRKVSSKKKKKARKRKREELSENMQVHTKFDSNGHALINQALAKGLGYEELLDNSYSCVSDLAVASLRYDDDEQYCECHERVDENGVYGGCTEASRCVNRLCKIECPKDCRAPHCGNQRLRNRQWAQTFVDLTPAKGRGLFAANGIEAGDLVVEYIGEVIDEERGARRRLVAYRKQRHCYMLKLERGYLVDATCKGSPARFMNHSCAPNCITLKWTVSRRLRIGLFALKDICKGDELTFDYQFESFGDGGQHPCHCGAPNCRRFLGARKSLAEDFVCHQPAASTLRTARSLALRSCKRWRKFSLLKAAKGQRQLRAAEMKRLTAALRPALKGKQLLATDAFEDTVAEALDRKMCLVAPQLLAGAKRRLRFVAAATGLCEAKPKPKLHIDTQRRAKTSGFRMPALTRLVRTKGAPPRVFSADKLHFDHQSIGTANDGEVRKRRKVRFYGGGANGAQPTAEGLQRGAQHTADGGRKEDSQDCDDIVIDSTLTSFCSAVAANSPSPPRLLSADASSASSVEGWRHSHPRTRCPLHCALPNTQQL